MSHSHSRAETLLLRIEDKARRGHRGDPVGTVAFYGPTEDRASKLVVGFSPSLSAGITETRKWLAEGDVREDVVILEDVLKFLADHNVRSVVVTNGVFGCPHEAGVDYPEGGTCEKCPFWKDRERNYKLIG